MLKLYDYLPSQNGYKVRLLCSLLKIRYELVNVNIFRGESGTPEFLKMNLAGRVPLLEVDDGRFLPESNAILFYLALDTSFLPEDKFLRAQVLQWLFFEQYTHEPSLAVARYWVLSKQSQSKKEELKQKITQGYEALSIMESHLENRKYFVNDQYTIADIALFAYTHVAHEGSFDLTQYRAINRWIARIQAHPLHYSDLYYYDPKDLEGIW